MKQFKLRASCGGKLATDPQSKKDNLSKTAQSYLKEWLMEQTYGYKNIISNKFMERGVEQEDKAIDKAIELLDLPFLIKNKDFFEDDFFTGTPDLILSNCVIDIKTSWSCFSFPLFDTEIPNKDYFYQLQIYIHLLNVPKAKLVYVLLDNEAIGHIYPKDSPRIKVFEINYNGNIINKLIEKIEYSREFINKLKQ